MSGVSEHHAVQALLPDPSCLKLKSVEHQDGHRVLITAAACGTVAYCPACHHASHSLHSRYSRALHDLPWQGSAAELRLDVRHFRCRIQDCPRVVFAETLPVVSPRHGRQTSRLSETVRQIGYVLGGKDELTQGFATVFRGKQSETLETWLNQARGTELPEIVRFCDGLRRDGKAIKVVLPWSNGQVEGQIHRLKLVKRQMYGRAKFNLLRRRVLPYVAAGATVSPQRAP
jgi:transposase